MTTSRLPLSVLKRPVRPADYLGYEDCPVPDCFTYLQAGHDLCAEHEKQHPLLFPTLGCGDVGCTRSHDES